MLGSLTLATFSLATLAAGLPSNLEARFSSNYVGYVGDGSTGAGWPSQQAWGSFDELWNANYPLIQKSCGYNGWGADNSAQETQDIRDAIVQVAGSSGVDQRFILAVMMQESKGCVRVPTTANAVQNPGLMQSHAGSGSCAGINPCPTQEIHTMISDGASGTSAGDGLNTLLDRARGQVGNNARAYYAAARLYNSGSVDYSNLNNGFNSVACYSSDVANRLTGWTSGNSQCRA